MPAYNCEKFISQAIDCILAQTYTNFELLILDDCSTDETRNIIDAYSDHRIKRFHNSVNLGYLQSSNKLVKEVQGDFITFQDADDYCSTDRLEKLIKAFNNNPELDCIGSNIQKVDLSGKILHVTNYPTQHEAILNGLLNHQIVMTGSALMVKRKVIDSIGLYSLYFDRIGSEDTYWYTIIIDRFVVANLDESLYAYRTNPNSVGFTHKNIKALGGHTLAVECFKLRRGGKTDPILDGNFLAADKLMWYILAKIKIERDGIKEFPRLFKAILNDPLGIFYHGRSVISIIKRKYFHAKIK